MAHASKYVDDVVVILVVVVVVVVDFYLLLSSPLFLPVTKLLTFLRQVNTKHYYKQAPPQKHGSLQFDRVSS